MSDLIDRQATAKRLLSESKHYGCYHDIAIGLEIARMIVEDYCPTVQQNTPTDTPTDIISRQAAIDAIESHMRSAEEPYYLQDVDRIMNYAFEIAASCIYNLPPAQPTLYGYSIEHLALIARVMQKENVTPEKAIECFKDIGRVVQMIFDEQNEMIKRAVEKWTI